MKKMNRVSVFCALVVIAALPAGAGNGHMLHGAGPVNSSMGGAGAALWLEPVGALMFNPALLAASDGNHVTFATEFFEDGVEIEVTLNELGAQQTGKPSGSRGVTNASGQIGILPSFGWSMHEPGSRWSFGFGLIAIAGFRTDYPNDPDSILFNTPPNGFGRIFTDYRVTKIPFALAYQVTPKLALGASLNAYVAELAIAPLPFLVFDENPPGDPSTRFYPQGDGLVNEFSFAAQLGFLYTASPKLSVGGSFTTPQNYDPFTWNSTFANPTLPNFGEARRLDYDLDGPFSATLGTGLKPNPKTSIAVDVMWIEYDGVSGFGSPGGIVDRVVYPFGWNDVWVYKAGVEYKPNPSGKWTLRGGYNYSNSPIRSEVVLSATGALATFEHHYTAGFSFELTSAVSAEAAFYMVPRNHIVGPYPDLDNNRLGTMDSSNKLDSVLVGLSWSF